jgi:hypothetical protein
MSHQGLEPLLKPAHVLGAGCGVGWPFDSIQDSINVKPATDWTDTVMSNVLGWVSSAGKCSLTSSSKEAAFKHKRNLPQNKLDDVQAL